MGVSENEAPLKTKPGNHKGIIVLCAIISVVFISVIVVVIGFLPTKHRVDGVWTYSHTYEGDSYTDILTLDEDSMRYECVTYKNGNIHSVDSGNWRIKSFEIQLEDADSYFSFSKNTIYRYMFGHVKGYDYFWERVK